MTFRARIFNAFAQSTANPAPSPTVAGAPTVASVSDLFPAVITGWGANNLRIIQLIVNTLNQAMFILSNGQMDFNRFRVANFQGEASNIPDQNLMFIVRYAKHIYNELLTQPYRAALNPKDKAARKTKLISELLASNIPDGSINPQLSQKIGGSIKTIITNAINTLR